MILFRSIFWILLFVLFPPFLSSAQAPFKKADLLTNGGFEEAGSRKDELSGWRTEGKVKRIRDKGDWKLKLTGESSKPDASAVQTLALPEPAPPALTVSALIKGKGIEWLSEDEEGFAAVGIYFSNEEGETVGKPKRLMKRDGTYSWRPWSGHTRIPEGAKTAEVRLEIHAAAGEAFFDDVELLPGFPEDYDLENFIVDGGIEYVNPLSPWFLAEGQKVVYPGMKGKAALRLEQGSDGSSATYQDLVFDPKERIEKAEFSLWFRLREVQALREGGGAKVVIEFRDAGGKPLGEASFGPWAGDEGWAFFRSQLKVPQGTAGGTLHLVMEEARGAAEFDEIRISAEGPGGKALLRAVGSQNDTRGWSVFEPAREPFTGPLDASGLLDPPAGRHGFFTATPEGHFAFEDGTPVRFFGINLQPPTALPTHKEAEALAERLSGLGFNLVRLHHLDNAWKNKPKLFDPAFDDTQHLSEEMLERLDYFIAQLKARGIYVYLDLYVSRKFKKGDGVPDYLRLKPALKLALQFDRRLIELQKKYAEDLFSHKNPYTGLRLADDPAVALTGIVNESTLSRFPKNKKKLRLLPPFYLEELQGLWVEHLRGQGAEEPEAQKEKFLELDDPRVREFYVSLQRNYFKEMYDFLRSLGVKIPIAGSNLAHGEWDLETNARLDFVDRHAYWAHPQGGYGDLVRFNPSLVLEEIEPKHLQTDSKRINPVLKLARLRAAGRPFVVGEWNINWPNEYRAAGPLLMAAYASFQDWDGILQFNFEGDLFPRKIEGNFDVSTKPEIFLALPAAARLFHERHIQRGRETLQYPVFWEKEVPLSLGLLHRIERILEGEASGPADVEARSSWVSDTEELRWNQREAVVKIDTPLTQAALGRVGGKKIELAHTRFASETPFAVLIVTSLDEKPVRDSQHLLLTTAARSENTGTVYNALRTFLRRSGSSPLLMEPVRGSVSIRREGAGPAPKIFALDSDGKRAGEIAGRLQKGFLEIPLGESFLYEVVWE